MPCNYSENVLRQIKVLTKNKNNKSKNTQYLGIACSAPPPPPPPPTLTESGSRGKQSDVSRLTVPVIVTDRYISAASAGAAVPDLNS